MKILNLNELKKRSTKLQTKQNDPNGKCINKKLEKKIKPNLLKN